MEQDKKPAGVPTHRVDAAVALILLLIGAVVVFESQRLGSKWASDGPEAGYFPFYIGLMLCLSGAATFIQSVFSKQKDRTIFVDREKLKRVLAVLVPALVYVAAIQLIGVYVASTAYIALFMVMLGKYSWVKSVAAAFIVNAAFFLMFEVWFKVPLYKGKIDLLSFLGY
ncbi:MAG: tripartite tricarboxylate transporter TctB family protein [Burkholderiales bacterium]|nr:tripartite tricarboxylate transporter TctB family protein [Burkholderiales bacterium]